MAIVPDINRSRWLSAVKRQAIWRWVCPWNISGTSASVRVAIVFHNDFDSVCKYGKQSSMRSWDRWALKADNEATWGGQKGAAWVSQKLARCRSGGKFKTQCWLAGLKIGQFETSQFPKTVDADACRTNSIQASTPTSPKQKNWSTFLATAWSSTLARAEVWLWISEKIAYRIRHHLDLWVKNPEGFL